MHNTQFKSISVLNKFIFIATFLCLSVCNVASSEYLLCTEFSMLWHAVNIFTFKLIRQMTGGLAVTKWQIFFSCVPARLIVRLSHF